MKRRLVQWIKLFLVISTMALAVGCGKKENITSLSQLKGKAFAVPTGTVADKLVLSKFPDAQFQYYNSVLDAAMAVKIGKADVAAYDEPILKNIAAKTGGLTVLSEKITVDNYAFAVNKDNRELKAAIDSVIAEMKSSGSYAAMQQRWFPANGVPQAMSDFPLYGANGVLRLGTAAVTEPFSFVDGSQKVVGLDIELARYVARKQGKSLEVVNMEFGAMIPALVSGKVDMIAACITVTEERAKKVMFSEPYYIGGISALVRDVKKP